MKLTFIKGEIYSPDDVEDLPKECNQYFDSEEFQERFNNEFEYCSVRCLKSFEITWKIKELY